MTFKKFSFLFVLFAYGFLLGISAFANGENLNENAPQILPEPGSEGDTLTREDARMALLVYKLLDKNGKIIGADIKKGEKLFYQNCRQCHGEDGKRFNFAAYYETPQFIGSRARNDMPTFWYQVNFGDAERSMQAYIDEFTLQELIDIAGFAQTLP